jgi:hypothetical protein
MKKTTRITMPRKSVLPLAAAALLGATDERPIGYRMTNIVPLKSRGGDRLRVAETDVDDEPARAPEKIKPTQYRSGYRIHHA